MYEYINQGTRKIYLPGEKGQKSKTTVKICSNYKGVYSDPEQVRG